MTHYVPLLEFTHLRERYQFGIYLPTTISRTYKFYSDFLLFPNILNILNILNIFNISIYHLKSFS
jgi:hypothetical protein